jgi:hypothetical protein
MRKTESLFDYFCQFINEVGSGNTYTSAELISHVGIHEVSTGWKKRSKNPYYTTRGYQTLLKRGGFLINTKRGHWMVSGTIPDWFTLAHLYTLVGVPYSSTYFNGDTNKWVNVNRCSMTRGEILSKLHGNKIAKDAIPTEVAGSLASSQSTTTYVPPFAGTTVTQEVFFTGNSNTYDAFLGQHTSSTPAEVKKIAQEDSEFYKQDSANQHMQRTQLDQNLRENIGLLEAATVIMDKVQILDPLVQGRVVNIFEQLKALLKTVDGRIEYKRINNNI